MKSYDLAIIGSGPGGYVAGLYGSRKKLKVCVIEKDLLGGTCLNRGCIPTKAMLKSASLFLAIKDSREHGIETDHVKVNFRKIIERRDAVVSKLRSGIETLFRANRVDLVKGRAVLKAEDLIDVDGAEIKARRIIIATGSRPAGLDGIGFDEKRIVSSDGILKITELPKNVLIIGGGVIGCEFASLFNALGAEVVLVELLERILTTQSKEASRKMESIFKKRGVTVITSSKVEGLSRESALKARLSNGQTVESEIALVSVGRAPNTDAMGLEKIGVKTERGRIRVDASLRTGAGDIYAIGDCVGAPLLAHKASYDGILACDNMTGESRMVDYSNIPNCIYTDPEIASVGLMEEEARAKFPGARVAKFPYLASGKALVIGATEGFIKIIGDSDGTILGIEIMGEGACDLIGEATLARTMGVKVKELSRVVHGHPTLSEIFQEAAHIFCGTGIHAI